MSELTEDNLEEILVPDEPAEEVNFGLATVDSITSTGVKLIFDGASESGGKTYKCNTSVNFQQGDRVKVHKESGSYVVEYIVGAPRADYAIPSGGTDGQVLMKDGSSNYAVKWGTISVNDIPAGGTAGQALVKNSATNYDVKWADISATKLGDGARYIEASGAGIAFHNITLGTSIYPVSGAYMTGSLELGTGSTSTNKIGFFGATPIARQTVSSTATVSTLISTLKSYGLIG